MPVRDGYAQMLLKKEAVMGQPYWPRVSLALAIRLRNACVAGVSKIPTPRILDELNDLEQLTSARQSRTKPAKKLAGPILGRFMHKHYTCTAFLRANIYNQWFGAHATKHELLLKEITKVVPLGSVIESEQEAWLRAGEIASKVAWEGYERLVGRSQMTGEWIIYYVHNGQNYYLDLAWHVEQEDEQRLYERLEWACS